MFENGVRGVMNGWTALRIGVENRWGGGTEDKAEELAREILRLFRGAETNDEEPVFEDELEDVLDEWFQSEVSILLEDGSVEEVAKILVEMRHRCEAGDFSFAMRHCATAKRPACLTKEALSETEMAPPLVSANRAARAQKAMEGVTEADLEREADGGEGEGGDDEPAPAASSSTVLVQPREDVLAAAVVVAAAAAATAGDAPKKKKPKKKKKSPEVDEDGWQIVGNKRKK